MQSAFEEGDASQFGAMPPIVDGLLPTAPFQRRNAAELGRCVPPPLRNGRPWSMFAHPEQPISTPWIEP
jgi:hypothetical protein